MMDYLAWFVWLGGVIPAYQVERRWRGAFWSAVSALAWPLGVGHTLCIRLYAPGVIRDEQNESLNRAAKLKRDEK